MSAIADLPTMIPDLIEAGCDVNSDTACVSYDFFYYDDYNSTDYYFYGENSTYDEFNHNSSHSYDDYYDDYYYETEYCVMRPLLHIAVAMNSTDFLRALQEVAIFLKTKLLNVMLGMLGQVPDVDWDRKDEYGYTALFEAFILQHDEAVTLLLEGYKITF